MMPTHKLTALIDGLGDCTLRPGDGTPPEVSSVVEDSRHVEPGSLFVARAGLSVDGRRFIGAAVEAGAVAVLTDAEGATLVPPGVPTLVSTNIARTGAALAERAWGSPTNTLSLVGVTGTNGKTTTVHLVSQILTNAGFKCGQIGTVVVDTGDGEPSPARMTTPDAFELSRLCAKMIDNGCLACAMEVSSHALHQHRADGLRFVAGVFTNLTGEHLNYHGSMDHYAGAKRRLFELIPDVGVGIVNADDPRGVWMLEPCKGTAQAASASGPSDWSVRTGEATLDGVELTVAGPEYTVSGRTVLLGSFNALNVCEAVAAADAVLAHAGVDVAERRRRVSIDGLAPPIGRLERIRVEDAPDNGPAVVVDYAHTDDAIERVLRALRGVMPEGGKLWIVFGPGGDRDRGKRPRMGAAAATHADHVVLTCDNPRTEPLASIFLDTLTGVPEGVRARVQTVDDRREAIRTAVRLAKAGDVVLIAGKGHETTQWYPDGQGGVRAERFSDREEAAEAMRARAGLA